MSRVFLGKPLIRREGGATKHLKKQVYKKIRNTLGFTFIIIIILVFGMVSTSWIGGTRPFASNSIMRILRRRWHIFSDFPHQQAESSENNMNLDPAKGTPPFGSAKKQVHLILQYQNT